MNKNHNYGIDLLRITAMVMIVAHHCALHGGSALSPDSGGEMLMGILALGGKTGVNIFVLITGFYSVGKIRRGKIIGLIGCTTFYSLVLTVSAVMLGSVALSKKLLLKAAFPWLLGEYYWFIVAYLELYLLTPILHKVAVELESRILGTYLAVFTGLLCIVPTVIGRLIQVNDFGYNTLVWFVYLYFLGAYLRKRKSSGKPGRYLLIAAVLSAVQIASCAAVQMGIGGDFGGRVLAAAADYNANALFPLTISVAMLLGFGNLTITRGRTLLQTAGAAMLGVYLFHDNANFRLWLWPAVFRMLSGWGVDFVAVKALLSVLCVFAAGCAVEICRMTLVRKVWDWIQNRGRCPELGT